MQIFQTDTNPYLSAQVLDDRRVCKMLVESVQILSTVLRLCGLTHVEELYQVTHPNHPAVQWAGKDRLNFEWLCAHAWGLMTQYELRYPARRGKHKCLIPLQTIHVLGDMLPEITTPPELYSDPEEMKQILLNKWARNPEGNCWFKKTTKEICVYTDKSDIWEAVVDWTTTQSERD